MAFFHLVLIQRENRGHFNYHSQAGLSTTEPKGGKEGNLRSPTKLESMQGPEETSSPTGDPGPEISSVFSSSSAKRRRGER